MAATGKQGCLDDLLMRIMTLDLAPGADLDEARLTEQYGISRTPLREVLQRLAGAGLIEITQNRGAKVASMDLHVLRTFFQTAPMIYAAVARLAAEHRSAAQLDGLAATQKRFRTARAGEAAMLNHQFHEQIGEMAQNPYLKASLDRMLVDHTRLSQTFYRPASEAEEGLVQTARDQHDAMIDALRDRDADEMVTLTLQHWDLSKDRMERFVRPDPLPIDPPEMKGPAHAV